MNDGLSQERTRATVSMTLPCVMCAIPVKLNFSWDADPIMRGLRERRMGYLVLEDPPNIANLRPAGQPGWITG